MTALFVPKGSPWLVKLARVLLVACSLVLLLFGATEAGWSLTGYVGWVLYTLWGLLFFYVLTTMSGKDSLSRTSESDTPTEHGNSSPEPAESDREAMRTRVRSHKEKRRGSSGEDSVD
ncbi:MAG: hypothetical protein HY914_08770 [Desulfomonile tiedjei]|nr:hypothetical protein [Desulfomonile tiedjei]